LGLGKANFYYFIGVSLGCQDFFCLADFFADYFGLAGKKVIGTRDGGFFCISVLYELHSRVPNLYTATDCAVIIAVIIMIIVFDALFNKMGFRVL
jgi:hypothetical protein